MLSCCTKVKRVFLNLQALDSGGLNKYYLGRPIVHGCAMYSVYQVIMLKVAKEMSILQHSCTLGPRVPTTNTSQWKGQQ